MCVCVCVCVCVCAFIREGRSTHAVRRVSVFECASALPSLDQMFFYLGARPPSDWGQPSPPTPHPLLQAAGRSASCPPRWPPRPGALVLGESESGPWGRWSLSRIWHYYRGKIIRDIIRECVGRLGRARGKRKKELRSVTRTQNFIEK